MPDDDDNGLETETEKRGYGYDDEPLREGGERESLPPPERDEDPLPTEPER